MTSEVSRRDFLKASIGLGVAGAALAQNSGNRGGGQNAPVPTRKNPYDRMACTGTPGTVCVKVDEFR